MHLLLGSIPRKFQQREGQHFWKQADIKTSRLYHELIYEMETDTDLEIKLMVAKEEGGGGEG